MPFTRETKLITIAQAVEILPVSQEYLRRLLSSGKMRGAVYGRRWMTTEEWVCEYIELASKVRCKNELPA